MMGKPWGKTGRSVRAVAAALMLGAVLMISPALAGLAQGLTAGLGGGSGGPRVTAMRVSQEGKGEQMSTRLVFTFDGKVDYRWFTLPQPARLVVDFHEDVKFDQEPSKLALPASGLVKAVRAGKFRPGIVRMVMDLDSSRNAGGQPGAKVSVFVIPASGGSPAKGRKPAEPAVGPRLVIDVMTLKKGDVATNVPPPSDVVTSDAAPAIKPSGEPTQAARAETAAENIPTQVPPRQVMDKRAGQAVVVLDAGHGGVDPGTHGRTMGILEKNLTLSMAKRVREALAGDGNIKVVLTRDTDIFIPLPDRVKIAQRANADLFVSLHADSAPNRNVTGATVYMVSDKASDRVAQQLAERENSGDVLAGVALENESKEVQNILISLVQRDTMNNSAYLGQGILNRMGQMTELRKSNLMYAGFRVLKAPDVPSVLVEMGYLTNPREENKLANEAYQQKLAKAIADGIRGFVGNHVHRQ